MRQADKLGVRWVLILGEDELAAEAVTVRDMEGRQDHPRAVSLGSSAAELRSALSSLAAVAAASTHTEGRA
jgi:histidyl-tRNA synthetase